MVDEGLISLKNKKIGMISMAGLHHGTVFFNQTNLEMESFWSWNFGSNTEEIHERIV
jgi:sugar (pentulose or hexulose) kinase